MQREPTKIERDQFENMMIGGILALNGVESNAPAYYWELTTLHGLLYIAIVPSLYGIHTVFQTRPDIDTIGGVQVDAQTGCWNHYRPHTKDPLKAAWSVIAGLCQVVWGDYVPDTTGDGGCMTPVKTDKWNHPR